MAPKLQLRAWSGERRNGLFLARGFERPVYFLVVLWAGKSIPCRVFPTVEVASHGRENREISAVFVGP